MPDREKVVKALECLKEGSYCECCDYKPYDDCIKRVATDALALLKEQQQQIWELQDQVEYRTGKQKEQEAVYPSWQNGKMYCGHCGSKFPPRVGMRFCHRCGVPIKLKVGEINETPMA